MAKKIKTKNNFMGTYFHGEGESVAGHLKLKGAKTLLTLYSDKPMKEFEDADTIQGLAYTGEHLTLIDCRIAGGSSEHSVGDRASYRSEIFPHFVIKGGSYLDPQAADVSAIQFTTNDLPHLFYDHDTFGHVIDSKAAIDAVLDGKRASREIEVGECPQVFYYTGKTIISEVLTRDGTVSVRHLPSFTFGGSSGVSLKNKIVVSLEMSEPVAFSVAISHLYKLTNFLSVLAGRVQSVLHVQVTTTAKTECIPIVLDVFQSYLWKAKDKSESNMPTVRDIPLDPVRRREEYEAVLSSWLEKHDKWRRARNRSLVCLGKSNKYSIDRLVSAANMFDILPEEAVPLKIESDVSLLSTVSDFKLKLRTHSESVDRNGLLNAIGRIGKPSLPKKVSFRVSIIDAEVSDVFPALDFVANVAVKCRNYYVHGSSGDLDFERVEPFIPFLTDALEFIFSASDLIESGWDAKSWSENHYGWGHSFTRFRIDYRETLERLLKATTKKQ